MMTLRPSTAIAWDIWQQSRVRLGLMATSVLVMGFANWVWLAGSSREAFGLRLGYVITVVALAVTMGNFHFTEGRRGGFGSFPVRLFTLPVATCWLVAWPMLFGSLVLALTYCVCAGLLLLPFSDAVAFGRPSLYLICGLLCFQTVLWSVPEQRYLKLFTLSAAATVLSIGWMFFKPDLIGGTLEAWGYQGDPAGVEEALTAGLLVMCGVAYGVSWLRVHQQRTGSGGSLRVWEWFRDAMADSVWIRRRPLTGGSRALFWYEWRQSGLILPVCVSIILILTYVPTYLTRPHSEADTMATLWWLFMVPFLFASLLGRGFGKVDFWRPELTVPVSLAVRPLTAADFVITKLRVAALSVALTWGLLLFSGFIWFAYAGNIWGVHGIWSYVEGFYRTPFRQGLLIVLTIVAMGLLSWRLLINGLIVGMAGRLKWYWVSNLVYTVGFVAVLAFGIHQVGTENGIPLFTWWPWIERLPLVLGGLAVLRFLVAAVAWGRLLEAGEVGGAVVGRILLAWIVGTGLLVGWVLVLASGVAWFRYLALLAVLFVCPLTSPALAIAGFGHNRSR